MGGTHRPGALAGAHRARHRDARGPGLHAQRQRDLPLRLHRVYRNTLAYFTAELERIGFAVWQDPVGTLIASNVAPDAPAFGVGSHCDSNRNGGKYDGTLGVCTALEVCRLAAEAGEGLPLRLISFLEEEGSGFGQMLLGSRIMLQRVTEQELRETIRDEHGVSFWDAAEAAGYEPARWRESIHALDNLTGWVEVHIEQGRVLQDTGTASASSRRSSATSTATCTSTAAAITPARRPWASVSTRPSRRPRRSSSSSGSRTSWAAASSARSASSTCSPA